MMTTPTATATAITTNYYHDYDVFLAKILKILQIFRSPLTNFFLLLSSFKTQGSGVDHVGCCREWRCEEGGRAVET